MIKLLNESGIRLDPSVTCILVNWNGWKDTLLCIEALYKIDYPHLSILVVDNGSTDESVAILREAYRDLTILETGANLGFSGGNNVGIRTALNRHAKYIWLLNNDTVVEAKTLTALVKLAEEYPALGQVGSVLYYSSAPDQVQAWGGGFVNLWTGVARHSHVPTEPRDLDYLTAASVLIPTSVLEKVGLLDEGYFLYWEDADLSFRIRAAGYELGVAYDAILLHKENASTGRKSAAMDRYVTASGIRFFRKYAPMPFIPIFILIFGRALKRFLAFDWARGWAVLSGMNGIGQMHSKRHADSGPVN